MINIPGRINIDAIVLIGMPLVLHDVKVLQLCENNMNS